MNLTTAPVTLASGAIVHMPVGTVHDVYASTPVALAAAPQVAPAADPALSGGSVAGIGGAALIGVILAAVTVAKWKSYDRSHKHGFIKGVACAILLSGLGLFGVLSNTVHSTGDSTGSVITTNLTNH
jgi:hypothetical protein